MKVKVIVVLHPAFSKDAHKGFRYAADMYIFRAATIIYLEGLEIQSSCLPDSYPMSISASTPP
jgi:hypothetical protein